jgi:hypothetical protein
MNETWFKVLGSERTIPMMVAITEKITVHIEWSESVLMTLAPVRICCYMISHLRIRIEIHT